MGEHCYAAKLVVLAVIGHLMQIFLMVLYGCIGALPFHFQAAFPIGAACEWPDLPHCSVDWRSTACVNAA